MLYCKGRGCLAYDKCIRYQRGKEFGFKPDEGLWYVNERECISTGYRDGVFLTERSPRNDRETTERRASKH